MGPHPHHHCVLVPVPYMLHIQVSDTHVSRPRDTASVLLVKDCVKIAGLILVEELRTQTVSGKAQRPRFDVALT